MAGVNDSSDPIDRKAIDRMFLRAGWTKLPNRWVRPARPGDIGQISVRFEVIDAKSPLELEDLADLIARDLKARRGLGAAERKEKKT